MSDTSPCCALTSLRDGEAGFVVSLGHCLEWRDRLMEMGVRASVRIERMSAGGGIMLCRVGHMRLAISQELAAAITVLPGGGNH